MAAQKARSRPSSTKILLVCLVVVGVVFAGCLQFTGRRAVEGIEEQQSESTFYQPPSPATAGSPGEIVRTEKLLSAPAGTLAWRVLYHSTDLWGTDIIVSGLVVTPDTMAPAGGRPIVGWAHPTTGAVPRCAPSNGVDPFVLIEGLQDLLQAGYAVAAADYPGLGIDGPDSYLIGRSEGNSVLDSIRAARNIPEVGGGSEILLWGHSQGGQAALFAGQDAATYAPELKVAAVAVAAPAADLGVLLEDHRTDASGVTLGSYAFAAFESVYKTKYPDISLDSILTTAGAAATPGMAQLCLLGQYTEFHAEAAPLVGKYLAHDPTTTEPWATLLQENTPGGSPLGVPLLVAQGESDNLVLPSATAKFVAQQCNRGEHVTYQTFPDTTHGTIATKAAGSVLTFFTSALQGKPISSTC